VKTLDVAKMRMGKATARPAPMPVMADITSVYTDSVIVVTNRCWTFVLVRNVPGFVDYIYVILS
jgi:hypothetical protein